SLLFLSTLLAILSTGPALAGAPPVRMSIITGGGSGIEQEIVDRLTARLSQNPNIAVSTVNPDWNVVCNIKDSMDQMSGQIRYNGSVLVKTNSGHVIASVAVQKYKQDFSLTPGAPLNKALVDRAAREAVAGAADRAQGPIENAVQVKMDTREKIIKAQIMAEGEEYDGAINSLRLVSPDSPHFQNARGLMEEFAMEKEALDAIKNAEANAAKGKIAQALALLKQVPDKSKYKARAKGLISSYSARLNKPAAKKLVKVKNSKPATAGTGSSSTGSSSTGSSKQAELKALDKVLSIEKAAIEKTQTKVRKELAK
ncbi:MAG: hypothetical protein K8F91_04445, partial [Candidatus Obscuribacterales bacterium]|nr:hypothetical protein [Candidatus Obscuribacterales bacterium]